MEIILRTIESWFLYGYTELAIELVFYILICVVIMFMVYDKKDDYHKRIKLFFGVTTVIAGVLLILLAITAKLNLIQLI